MADKARRWHGGRGIVGLEALLKSEDESWESRKRTPWPYPFGKFQLPVPIFQEFFFPSYIKNYIFMYAMLTANNRAICRLIKNARNITLK